MKKPQGGNNKMERHYVKVVCEEEKISSEFVFYNFRYYDQVIARLQFYGASKQKKKNGVYVLKDLISYNKLLIDVSALLEQY